MKMAAKISGPDAILWRPLMWGAIAALLLLPAIAMQFTTEVVWDKADFAAAALLLTATGAVIERAFYRITGAPSRALAAMAIILVAGTIWADAAVGIF